MWNEFNKWFRVYLFRYVVLSVLLFGCNLQATSILGGGASFPNPLLQKMIEEYYFERGVTVNYTVLGSAHGYQSLRKGVLDFAASEIPRSVLERGQEGKFVFIPVTMGAVSLVYNLPGNPVLKFTPSIVHKILIGDISTWNDPRIQALNLSITLPNIPIQVFGRGQYSGTQYLISAFLKKQRFRFSKWAPSTSHLESNKAVCESVQATVGSVGISEWQFAKRYRLPMAAIQNRSGAFIVPSLNSIRSAVYSASASLKEMGLLDTSIPEAYPICGYSWIITHLKQDKLRSFEEAQELVRLLSWVTHHGQLLAEEINYPSLPPVILKRIEDELTKITHSGIVLF